MEFHRIKRRTKWLQHDDRIVAKGVAWASDQWPLGLQIQMNEAKYSRNAVEINCVELAGYTEITSFDRLLPTRRPQTRYSLPAFINHMLRIEGEAHG